MYRLRTLVCLSILAAAFQAPAHADKLNNVIALDISPQPIEASLIEFSRQAGLQLVIQTGALPAHTAPRISGSMRIDAALKLLLGNTDLSYKLVGNRTLTIISSKDRAPKRETAALPVANLQLAEAGVAATDSANAEEKNQPQQVASEGELTVTGTRDPGIINQGVIPREENQAVRYQIISREDIERSGLTSTQELMRRVSGNAQHGTTTQRALAAKAGVTGLTFSNGDQVDLRGFGANQTLIMVNGRRLYGSETFVGPDVSRIPLSAIERVEILPASGSAMYGANSVGGVINFILRKNFSGSEASAYVGSADGGAEEGRFNLFHGVNFNRGRSNLTFNLEYQRQNALDSSERAYYNRALKVSALQGPSRGYTTVILPYFVGRRPTVVTTAAGLGIPANAAAFYASAPAGSSGAGLTPASFSPNTAVLSDERLGRQNLIADSQSYGALMTLEHEILGERLGVYTELAWRESNFSITYPYASNSVSLSATSPINPFRTGVTAGFVGRAITVYRAPEDLPDTFEETERGTRRAVAGLKGKWTTDGGRTFGWSLDGSWDRSQTDTFEHIATYFGVIAAAANAGVYDIFRDLTGVAPLPAAEADKFRVDQRYFLTPTVAAANLRFNGELFDARGGPVLFSVGAERRKESGTVLREVPFVGEYNFLPGASGASAVGSRTRTQRDVNAGYVEVTVPVVSASVPLRWLYSLDFSGGLRYEKYSDAGAAKPPLMGMKIGLTQDIALRAAYQEGFQPPTISQLSAPGYIGVSTAAFTDALRPGAPAPASYTQTGGGNPDLRSETAQTWDAGIVITPRAVPGLTVNVSYFRFDKVDVVTNLSLTDAIVYAPERITRAAQTADDIAANRPGVVTAYDARPINISSQFTDGVDFSVRYNLLPTRLGLFSVSSDGTWTRRFLRQARPDAPILDSVGILPFFSSFNSPPLEWRGNGTLAWSREAWSASVTGAYTGSFQSNTTNPTARNPAGRGFDGNRIDDSLTFDAQVTYQPGSAATDASKWLEGTRWTFGVLNLFDAEPAYWSDGVRGYHSQSIDARQRFIYMQVRKAF